MRRDLPSAGPGLRLFAFPGLVVRGNAGGFFPIGEPSAERQNRAVHFRDKIIALDELPGWRAKFRAAGKTLVATNGCFDILHIGHLTCLEMARDLGDALLVGVNGDAAARELKGRGRPVNSEGDRASVLAGLECVSVVCIFPEITATKFLEAARPDVYVKGGDYTVETLNDSERRAVEEGGGRVQLIPFVPGKSTTALLEKISRR